MFCKGKIKYVLSSTFTEEGFVSCLPDLLANIERVYILKGAPGTGKATFIRLLGESMLALGYELEYWISAADAVNPEGIYFPQLDVAVVNGSSPVSLEPRYPHVSGDIINLGECLDTALLKEQAQLIISHIDRWHALNREAKAELQGAVRAKHIMKRGNSVHLNMQQLYNLADLVYEEATGGLPPERHLFASAMTAQGHINYVQEISSDCRQRLILVGPMGSGKSTILAEIARKARQGGHSVEYYHSGMSVDSLLMIILPAFRTAVIDGGDLQLPSRPGDKTINTTAILDDFDIIGAARQHSDAIRDYEDHLTRAQEKLEEACRQLKALKQMYAARMDFEALNQRRQALLEEILDN